MTEEKHIFEQAFEEGLGTKVVESLMDSDYETLEELHDLNDKELNGIKGVGKNSINPIRALLAARGFVKDQEFDTADAQAKLAASQAAPEVEKVKDKGTGKSLPRRRGQVIMNINLVDNGYRRKNNGQKLSVLRGDVIWGNKDKDWDLTREKVDELIAKGDAA